MGGMTTTGLARDGGGMSSSWFTDSGPGGGQVGAVVLWRQKPRPERRPRRIRSPKLHLLVFWLFVRTGILPRLWPRGFEAWMHGSFKEADARRAEWMAEIQRQGPPDDDWGSSSGMGNDKIRYSSKRRVVGFRGRVFGPAPAGQALLVLIEDDDGAPDGVRVVERTFPIPILPPLAPPNSGTREERMKQVQSRHAQMDAALRAAMESDPAYQQFMNPSASRSAEPGTG